ncbi:MAG: hypothetical protein HDR39_00465 [Treponema sp.]|nr:hypothetical protein [Treponema sp.]
MTEEQFNMESMRVQLAYLVEAVRTMKTAEPERLPEFITLELAAKLKGGAAYNTYKTRVHLQPCGGARSVRVGGRKCWKKADVLEWLTVDDNALESYLHQFGRTVKQY